MKLNKRFAPLPFDEDDELYSDGIFVFNITKLLAFIKSKPERFPVETVLVSELHHFSSDHLDQETLKNANLSNPIILAEISPNRYNVIDGNHRVERARIDGCKTIPAFRVQAEDHIAFLNSIEGYECYIKYWNEKLKT